MSTNSLPDIGLPQGVLLTQEAPLEVAVASVTLDRATMLAEAPRGRLNEFAIGAACVAVPGSAQSICDIVIHQKIPEVGHLVELALAIAFVALTIRSLIWGGETSTALLRRLFPAATKRKGVWPEFKYWWFGDP